MSRIDKFESLPFDVKVGWKALNIMAKLGYNTNRQWVFNKEFKEKYGMTYREYRKKIMLKYIEENYNKMNIDELSNNLNVTPPIVYKLLRESGKKIVKKSHRETNVLSYLDEINMEYIRKRMRKLFGLSETTINIIKYTTGSDNDYSLEINGYYYKLLYKNIIVATGRYYTKFPYNLKGDILKLYRSVNESKSKKN